MNNNQRQHQLKSPPHFTHFYPQNYNNALRITLPSQLSPSSPSKNHNLRTTTNDITKFTNTSLEEYNFTNTPQAHSTNATYNHIPSDYNRVPNTARYSFELKQLREELCNLKNNLKKIQKDVSTKGEKDIFQVSNINRKDDPDMHISLNNTDRSNRESVKRNINLHKRKQAQQWDQRQRDLINSLKISQNNNNPDFSDKIDYIFKKLKEYQGQKHTQYQPRKRQVEKLLSQGDEITSECNALLERINEKTLQLRRTEIKHIALFMDIKTKQQNQQINTFRMENIPDEWLIFERQLKNLIHKFECVIEDHESTKAEERRFSKLKSKSIHIQQYNNLLQQSKLKEEENQMLKLQYAKLKSKILELEKELMESQNVLEEQKSSKLEHISEIQRLQQIIENQNQKIEIINSMKNKKQDIQKQFQQVFQELSLKNHQNQFKVMNLQKQISLKNEQKTQIIANNNLEKNELRKYIQKIQIENHQLIQIIKSTNKQLNSQIFVKHKVVDNTLKYNSQIKQLLQQLGIKLKIIINKQLQQEQILKKIIEKVDNQKYSQIYENYLQVIKLFQVNVNSPNHFGELMKQIELFRNDIKLLFSKVQQLSYLNQKYQSQKKETMEQICYYQLKLKQGESKISQMQNIINKQNEKNLGKEMTWINEKLLLKEQIKMYELIQKKSIKNCTQQQEKSD